nr:hypothetical protein TetV2_00056 [Oceanusvirus sp.]
MSAVPCENARDRLVNAASKGELGTISRLMGEGYLPTPVEIEDVYLAAAANEHAHVLRFWLAHTNHPPPSDVLSLALENADPGILGFIVDLPHGLDVNLRFSSFTGDDDVSRAFSFASSLFLWKQKHENSG